MSIDNYPLLQDFYLHKSTSLKPIIGPLNEMAIWNPTTKEIKKIIVPSPPFCTYFSGPCCSDSPEKLQHSCQILQKCVVSRGSDMQTSAVLKIPSNNDFRLCCSDSPEMLPHPCRILQNCAASGGSDMHRSTFMKSPGNNGFRLCCSDSSEMLPHAYSLEMLSHPCRILQKRVVAASGDSDMHPSTFLKSSRSYAHHFGFGMDPLSKDYKKIDSNRRCEILAFDFRNENFQVIQTPNVFNLNIGTLGLYDGYVSMLFHSKTCIEIWVMEKIGFWTRKLVVESLIIKRPIGYGVNGEIFVETTSSNLVMIDPRTQEIVKCIGPLENGYSLQVLVYKKSLVSIKKLRTCNLIRGLEFEQQRVSDNV
ncbi:hypothetical protein P3S68_029016 [Capsicum galapagoense]